MLNHQTKAFTKPFVDENKSTSQKLNNIEKFKTYKFSTYQLSTLKSTVETYENQEQFSTADFRVKSVVGLYVLDNILHNRTEAAVTFHFFFYGFYRINHG